MEGKQPSGTLVWIIYAVPYDQPTPVHIWTPEGTVEKCRRVEIRGMSKVVSVPEDEAIVSPEGKTLVVWVETVAGMTMYRDEETGDGGV